MLLVQRNKLDDKSGEVIGRQFRLPASDKETKQIYVRGAETRTSDGVGKPRKRLNKE